MKLTAQGTPNASLRRQRLGRGWSLRHVADELCALCEEEDGACSITADMIGKWERGIHRPSPFYREKLCRLYGLSADQLGFIEPAKLSPVAKTT
jgi:transcriptional regulator with XRE-family HTH domain